MNIIYCLNFVPRYKYLLWLLELKTPISTIRMTPLRTFAPKSCHAQIFFKLSTQKVNDILLPKRQKLGVTDFVLERPYPEKYPKSEKSGFVS